MYLLLTNFGCTNISVSKVIGEHLEACTFGGRDTMLIRLASLVSLINSHLPLYHHTTGKQKKKHARSSIHAFCPLWLTLERQPTGPVAWSAAPLQLNQTCTNGLPSCENLVTFYGPRAPGWSNWSM